MKRKVIQFLLILLAFMLVLAAFEFVRFGGLTGFVVYNNESQTASENTFTGNADLVVLKMEDIELDAGSSGNYVLSVLNSGDVFLNNCELLMRGALSSYFSSVEKKGLSPGERFSFDFNINLPKEVDGGIYVADFIVRCDEITKLKTLDVSVNKADFDVSFVSYNIGSGKMKEVYNIIESIGEHQDININYTLKDSEGYVLTEGSQERILGARYKGQQVIEFDLPKDSFGELTLELGFSNGRLSKTISQQIFVPQQKGINAFVVSEGNKGSLFVLFVFLALGAFAYFVIARAVRYQKKMNNIKTLGNSRDKGFIKINLSDY
jgi:hypothetical protein